MTRGRRLCCVPNTDSSLVRADTPTLFVLGWVQVHTSRARLAAPKRTLERCWWPACSLGPERGVTHGGPASPAASPQEEGAWCRPQPACRPRNVSKKPSSVLSAPESRDVCYLSIIWCKLADTDGVLMADLGKYTGPLGAHPASPGPGAAPWPCERCPHPTPLPPRVACCKQGEKGEGQELVGPHPGSGCAAGWRGGGGSPPGTQGNPRCSRHPRSVCFDESF